MSVRKPQSFDARRETPVEWDVEAPARISVTLAKKADACPRDAGLYLKHRGGASSGPLLRGSLAHLFAERHMAHLMMHREGSLFAPQQHEDPAAAAAEVAQTTKEWVDELADETGWPICEADLDDVRVMAYHMAIGNDVDPETVVALERKFVYETPDGTLSGKVDLASLPPDGTLQVDDYKTSFYVPPDEDFGKMVQVPWYAVLLLWGRPVDEAPCEACGGTGVNPATPPDIDAGGCEACGGGLLRRGRGKVETLGEPLGLADEVQWVRARQVYPRFLKCAARAVGGGECGGKMGKRGCMDCGSPGPGRMAYREKLLGLADLRDKVSGLQRAMRRVNRGVADRVWPAVDGPHCSECTAQRECPLPSQLRRHGGTINTAEQASEAMEWFNRQTALTAATRKEVVAFVKAHEELEGELPVGAQTYSLQVSYPTALKKKGSRSDWDGLQQAVLGAAEEGQPFDVNDWLKQGTKTDFKVKKEED